MRILRFGNRSATIPPHGPSSSDGMNCSATVMPDCGDRAGELQHQPVLRDSLHPESNYRDEVPDGENAEVVEPGAR